jgi:predicted transcriptional regulator
MFDELEQYAMKNDMTHSQIVRKAISTFLKNEKETVTIEQVKNDG